jgi:hypothetical protein
MDLEIHEDTTKVLSHYNGKKLISPICSSDEDLRKEKSKKERK